jgi:phosphoglycerate dehydrogenase-like enzyme
MLTVAFAGTFATRLHERIQPQLAALGCTCLDASETSVLEHLAKVDVLVTMGFTPAMGAAARRLKLVQVPGAGLDRIDRAALPPGTWLANAYGHETGIAEYVIGALLTLSRDFGRLDARLREGEWASQWSTVQPPPAPWPELAGKTLGILGYGRIGRALARRARAFDMKVWAMRRQPLGSDATDLAFLGGPESLDRILRHADCLVVALSLSPATRGLLGRRELGLLKPGSILVNVARGEIVDEDALYEALRSGGIAAAALDVWYRYPAGPGPTLPAGRPFQELPNVLMTPHVSGWTEGMLESRAQTIAENIRRVSRGEPPTNLVQPA